jgi:hypothetical protein
MKRLRWSDLLLAVPAILMLGALALFVLSLFGTNP